jgi:hypothetical protein
MGKLYWIQYIFYENDYDYTKLEKKKSYIKKI